MSVLVIDVGTSSVRASVIDGEAHVRASLALPLVVDRSRPGVVEFDADALGRSALEVATAVLERAGPVQSVGIAAQRASTIVFERVSGKAVGPGIGWEDLRTAGQCLALGAQGLRLSPNQSATKLATLLREVRRPPEEVCFGTVECFLAHRLSGGALHVSDATNAALTGLVTADATRWDPGVLEILAIPATVLPRIVDSSGVLGPCTALAGNPPLAGLVGDQQASLVGQDCLAPGQAKITFGTGGMLDVVIGPERPAFATRGPGGTFPIVTRREAGRCAWGLEAVMLSAGSAVAWLRDGLGLISSVEESDALAASARDAGGVVFVPALSGLGTPDWDFGARGVLVGLSASTTRAEVVRAVLEGIAQRGADLLEATESDLGAPIAEVRVDGGMSRNATFVSLLASATGRGIACSEVTESTTLGAAFLAGGVTDVWPSVADAARLARRRPVVEPGAPVDRARWQALRDRSRQVVPALSALSF